MASSTKVVRKVQALTQGCVVTTQIIQPLLLDTHFSTSLKMPKDPGL
jgi:hypothetical protein